MESANIDPVASEMSQNQPKWQGQACADLAGPKADQIWPFLEDFFGLDKWFPTLATCTPVEGVSGQPGCVRYCAGFRTPVDQERDIGGGTEAAATLNWTKQKLLSIDPAEKMFSYSIVDSNVGFNSYVSTVRVMPKEDGCRMVWDYEVEPVSGWKPQDLDQFIGSGLRVMAERMKEALLGQANRSDSGTDLI
ncbi:lachrymatory-factor synthase-like [Eucalyptus grandis]|uniref:lachrymatory-factor synthase-like n=1 Tax=Eucalyptus grandis TaxID=71139 RepID=UPI00192EDC86|nr:lachrymatory-factor synthase-like [Eucalyptus grandis]